jgi:predicted outer membrane protein
MNKFGELKSKMLTKLTESYTKENKTEVKDILKTIKENKNFKEMYLFYEEIENKYIEDKETAKLYVEGVSVMLNQESNDLSTFCESLNKKLGDIEITTNELYESLDQLMVKDSLSNIENKVIAKKKLVNHLTTKKEVNESKQSVYSQNENLLHAVLANNFNVLYSNTLSESQQEELKTILSIPNEELDSKTIELKESIRNQVNSLLNEAVADDEMSSKLNKVKSEVEEMKTSRYNYYRLTELKNGLN